MKDETKHGRAAKKLCMNCRERRALSNYRGVVRWRRGFDLCFRCHRSLADSMRARPFEFVFAAAQPDVQLPLAA